MIDFLPYIVSVICSLISGFVTYIVSRRQVRAEIQKIEKQHELNLEAERQKFDMEKEKMELEHKHQLEMKQKEMENQLGTDVLSSLIKEYLRSPAGQAQMRSLGGKRHH